ncbi:MAG: HEPN domain-containing protein [Candidatus Bathyarchaeia archaeon]
MNNLELARAYLDEAKMRVETARRALEEEALAYCIRQSQEAVELSLKGALRFVGIEPPKWHDVGIILIENKDRFPEWFKSEIESIASTSRWLRREREPSMYGDEELGLPPKRIFTKSYAERAFKEASNVFEVVSKLVR